MEPGNFEHSNHSLNHAMNSSFSSEMVSDDVSPRLKPSVVPTGTQSNEKRPPFCDSHLLNVEVTQSPVTRSQARNTDLDQIKGLNGGSVGEKDSGIALSPSSLYTDEGGLSGQDVKKTHVQTVFAGQNSGLVSDMHAASNSHSFSVHAILQKETSQDLGNEALEYWQHIMYQQYLQELYRQQSLQLEEYSRRQLQLFLAIQNQGLNNQSLALFEEEWVKLALEYQRYFVQPNIFQPLIYGGNPYGPLHESSLGHSEDNKSTESHETLLAPGFAVPPSQLFPLFIGSTSGYTSPNFVPPTEGSYYELLAAIGKVPFVLPNGSMHAASTVAIGHGEEKVSQEQNHASRGTDSEKLNSVGELPAQTGTQTISQSVGNKKASTFFSQDGFQSPSELVYFLDEHNKVGVATTGNLISTPFGYYCPIKCTDLNQRMNICGGSTNQGNHHIATSLTQVVDAGNLHPREGSLQECLKNVGDKQCSSWTVHDTDKNSPFHGVPNECVHMDERKKQNLLHFREMQIESAIQQQSILETNELDSRRDLSLQHSNSGALRLLSASNVRQNNSESLDNSLRIGERFEVSDQNILVHKQIFVQKQNGMQMVESLFETDLYGRQENAWKTSSIQKGLQQRDISQCSEDLDSQGQESPLCTGEAGENLVQRPLAGSFAYAIPEHYPLSVQLTENTYAQEEKGQDGNNRVNELYPESCGSTVQLPGTIQNSQNTIRQDNSSYVSPMLDARPLGKQALHELQQRDDPLWKFVVNHSLLNTRPTSKKKVVSLSSAMQVEGCRTDLRRVMGEDERHTISAKRLLQGNIAADFASPHRIGDNSADATLSDKDLHLHLQGKDSSAYTSIEQVTQQEAYYFRAPAIIEPISDTAQAGASSNAPRTTVPYTASSAEQLRLTSSCPFPAAFSDDHVGISFKLENITDKGAYLSAASGSHCIDSSIKPAAPVSFTSEQGSSSQRNTNNGIVSMHQSGVFKDLKFSNLMNGFKTFLAEHGAERLFPRVYESYRIPVSKPANILTVKSPNAGCTQASCLNTESPSTLGATPLFADMGSNLDKKAMSANSGSHNRSLNEKSSSKFNSSENWPISRTEEQTSLRLSKKHEFQPCPSESEMHRTIEAQPNEAQDWPSLRSRTPASQDHQVSNLICKKSSNTEREAKCLSKLGQYGESIIPGISQSRGYAELAVKVADIVTGQHSCSLEIESKPMISETIDVELNPAFVSGRPEMADDRSNTESQSNPPVQISSKALNESSIQLFQLRGHTEEVLLPGIYARNQNTFSTAEEDSFQHNDLLTAEFASSTRHSGDLDLQDSNSRPSSGTRKIAASVRYQAAALKFADSEPLMVPPLKRKDHPTCVPWRAAMAQPAALLPTNRGAELQWAAALNRLTEKDGNGVDLKDENTHSILHAKQRLKLTTQLLQTIVAPVPAELMESKTIADREAAAYILARLVLGEACSMAGSRSGICKSSNHIDLSGKHQEVVTGRNALEVAEYSKERAKQLERDLSRIEDLPCTLEIMRGMQELDKLSISNRLVARHSEVFPIEECSYGSGRKILSDLSVGFHKVFPRRYVRAVPMPSSLPHGAHLTSL
ncbi:hypothetical protein O6H91_18G032600 [Diphasiastrum complanatum]|nr:hypothetical protein O6H91_18G032600 [Diphasiastrum complanatum]KAJ7522958.1 hypothetical protein O6H91_18G032600 [Diphasiastrum complanatum]